MIRATLAAASILGLVGCTTTEGGSPSAGPSGSTTTTADDPETTTASSSTSTTVASPLAGLDPCALLPQADATQLGFDAGQRRDLAGLLRCAWTEPGKSVRIVLDLERGLADTNNGSATKVEDVQVGRHAGRRVEESSGPGYCEFDIAVTDKTHVTVAAIILDKTPESCALAQQAAAVVEAKLP